MANNPRDDSDPTKLTLSIPFKEGTLSINTVSRPFHFDPPYARDFHESIGQVVLLWGRFEQSFEWHLNIIINIARQFGIEERMQVSFGRKADALRRLYARCEPLAPYAQATRDFTQDAERASEDRNLLIHSNWSGFIDGDPPRLHLENAMFKNGTITRRKVTPSLQNIKDLAAHIDYLQSHLMQFMFEVNHLQPGFAELGKGPPQAQSGGGSTPPTQE